MPANYTFDRKPAEGAFKYWDVKRDGKTIAHVTTKSTHVHDHHHEHARTVQRFVEAGFRTSPTSEGVRIWEADMQAFKRVMGIEPASQISEDSSEQGQWTFKRVPEKGPFQHWVAECDGHEVAHIGESSARLLSTGSSFKEASGKFLEEGFGVQPDDEGEYEVEDVDLRAFCTIMDVGFTDEQIESMIADQNRGMWSFRRVPESGTFDHWIAVHRSQETAHVFLDHTVFLGDPGSLFNDFAISLDRGELAEAGYTPQPHSPEGDILVPDMGLREFCEFRHVDLERGELARLLSNQKDQPVSSNWIKGLRLGNFKAIGRTQAIPLRPITLVFGPNSAGKSSLLHGLLLAHHAMLSKDEAPLDTHRVELGGDSVDLGGFKQYVHRHKVDSKVSWSAEVSLPELKKRCATEKATPLKRLCEIAGSVNTIRVDLAWGVETDDYGRARTGALPRVVSYELLFDEVEVLRASLRRSASNPVGMKSSGEGFGFGDGSGAGYGDGSGDGRGDGDGYGDGSGGGYGAGMPSQRAPRKAMGHALGKPEPESGDAIFRIDALAYDHPVVKAVVEAVLLYSTTTTTLSSEDHAAIEKGIVETLSNLSISTGTFMPKHVSNPDEDDGKTRQIGFFAVSKGSRQEDLAKVVKAKLPRILDELIYGVHEAVSQQFSQMRYLGPLRSYPPRHLAFAENHDLNWYAGGGHAWDVVLKNDAVRKKVNAWLSDKERLQTPYRLEIRQHTPIEGLRALLTKVIEDEQVKPDSMRNQLVVLETRLETDQTDLDTLRELAEAEENLKEMRRRHEAAEDNLEHLQEQLYSGSLEAATYDELMDQKSHHENVMEEAEKGITETDAQIMRLRRQFNAPTLRRGGFETNAALEKLEESVARKQREVERLRAQIEETEAQPLADKDAGEIAAKLFDSILASDPESLRELVLMDLRSNSTVSHRDVGIGVSQVLPVLVGAYAGHSQTLLIEQPEIHLHPRLQAELGDVFIESALGPQRNTFFLETHSEHLILRLMRRMRNTSDGELPEGLPPVRPEDVAILYVCPQDTGESVILHLRLDEEGALLDPWPGGFFEEGFRERFS